MLEGCWNLDSNYTIRDVRTGQISRVSAWRMCFDRNGQGRQTLTYENGVRCEGGVTGRFAQGSLQIEDEAAVECSNGSRIFRRIAQCTRSGDARAECESRQPDRPDGGGSARYTLRR
jgi:hypothetical protein